MAFDRNAYLSKNSQTASTFDRDSYVQKSRESDQGKSDRFVQTAVESTADEFTLNNLSSLQAASEYAARQAEKGIKALGFPNLGPETNLEKDQKLRDQGFDVQEPTFSEMKSENEQRLEQLREENPGAALLGDTAGLLGSTALMSPLRTFSFAAKVPKAIQAAGIGGATAFLSDIGDKSFTEQVDQAKEGALLGGVTQAGLQMAGPVGRFASKVVRSNRTGDLLSRGGRAVVGNAVLGPVGGFLGAVSPSASKRPIVGALQKGLGTGLDVATEVAQGAAQNPVVAGQMGRLPEGDRSGIEENPLQPLPDQFLQQFRNDPDKLNSLPDSPLKRRILMEIGGN